MSDLNTIGIIGQGFVGSALRDYFDRDDPRGGRFSLVTYDKEKGGDINSVVSQSDVIFVCVPTPMRESGECFTGIVESVLSDIEKTAVAVNRRIDEFVVCIKSTIPPGFIGRARKIHPLMRITFNPEFLREAHAVEDMLNSNRFVVGGSTDDANVVLSCFYRQDIDRASSGELLLLRVGDDVAEMVKLFTNGILFTKVVFANEIYQMCERLGIDFNEVRMVSAIDPRVGLSHTQVPGPDGHLGAGGHCFPKDMNNLRFEARRLGTNERLFSAVLERNDELRDERDWEKMEGRAVIKG
jgi:UDPglucose 6-dehydrogenase